MRCLTPSFINRMDKKSLEAVRTVIPSNHSFECIQTDLPSAYVGAHYFCQQYNCGLEVIKRYCSTKQVSPKELLKHFNKVIFARLDRLRDRGIRERAVYKSMNNPEIIPGKCIKARKVSRQSNSLSVNEDTASTTDTSGLFESSEATGLSDKKIDPKDTPLSLGHRKTRQSKYFIENIKDCFDDDSLSSNDKSITEEDIRAEKERNNKMNKKMARLRTRKIIKKRTKEDKTPTFK